MIRFTMYALILLGLPCVALYVGVQLTLIALLTDGTQWLESIGGGILVGYALATFRSLYSTIRIIKIMREEQ